MPNLTKVFTDFKALIETALSANNITGWLVAQNYNPVQGPKEQVSLNFMAAVTIHSDFGAQENKICCCFHFSPFYLPQDRML